MHVIFQELAGLLNSMNGKIIEFFDIFDLKIRHMV